MRFLAIFIITFLALHSVISIEFPRHDHKMPSIAQYKGNAPAAISLTFDDGDIAVVDNGVEALKPFGFKGTFFVIVGEIEDKDGTHAGWEKLKKMANAGHEIGNHTWDHKRYFYQMGDKVLQQEVVKSSRLIDEKLGRKTVSFAFPYNEFDETSASYVLRYQPFVRFKEFCYGGPDWSLDKANKWIDDTIKSRKWGAAMFHDVKSESPMFKMKYSDLMANLKYLKDAQDKNLVWVATYGEVGKYCAERNASRIQYIEHVPGRIVFKLTCPLSKEIYNEALTVKIPASAPPANVSVLSGDKAIPFKVRGNDILLDVIPDGSLVKVSWN